MLNISEEFVNQYFTGENTIPELGDAMAKVLQYAAAAESYGYQSKRDRVWEFYQSIREPDQIVELVISIFTACLLNGKVTLASLCGMLNHKMPHEQELDRVKTIAEILAIVATTELIYIDFRGKYENTMVRPGYSIDEEIPVENKHQLRKHPVQKVTSNYDDVEGSMLLGGTHTHHTGEICLRHLNDMNQIPMSLNVDLLRTYEEMPTFKLDTPEKAEQWRKFKHDSIWKYVEGVRDLDNKLYLKHAWDTRGRCYAVGYHISTQGTSYKKAILQLHNKELVTDEIY